MKRGIIALLLAVAVMAATASVALGSERSGGAGDSGRSNEWNLYGWGDSQAELP